MNNPIIGFIFGVLVTVITALCSLGEINIWAFAGITGIFLVAVKEVVNLIMIGNEFNGKNVLASVAGVVITSLALLFIL